MNGLGRDRIVTLTIEGESIRNLYATVLTSGDPTYTPLSLSGDDSADSTARAQVRADHRTRPRRRGNRPRPRHRPAHRWRRRSDLHGPMAGPPAMARADSALQGCPRPGTVSSGPSLAISRTSGPPNRSAIRRGSGRSRPTSSRGRASGSRESDRPVERTTGARRPSSTWRSVITLISKIIPGRDLPWNPARTKSYRTDADGRFRAVAFWQGILVVRSLEPGYLTALPLTAKAAGNVLDVANFSISRMASMRWCRSDQRENEVTVIPDITLTPGSRQHVRPVGSNGRPIERTLNFGEQSRSSLGDLVPGTDSRSFTPGRARPRGRHRQRESGNGGVRRYQRGRARPDLGRAATFGDRHRAAGR